MANSYLPCLIPSRYQLQPGILCRLDTRQKGNALDVLSVMQIVPNFRVRTIPVLGTMPAIFGMAAASYILCQLAQLPFHPEPIFKLVEGQYETQLQRLAEREDLVYGNSEGPAVDLDDVRPLSLHCKAWPFYLHALFRWPVETHLQC